ncbi:pre-peptidase C-terminal domain-containing protein [Pleionea sp. CnH1-48]|uniref:pre-peptidase C-terminal domain-containing protein n=1 Tax=Pleionea sp. CnH1-48 TaxID=2954494 RepID=UPI00273A7466|nr:pre-peptidase C-terminal domain-containing protein [Pleionea sp. CnH1-48]
MNSLNGKFKQLKTTALCAMVLGGVGLSSAVQAEDNAKVSAWSSEKIAPTSFSGDLRNLPTANPWQFGDEVKTMPRKRFDPSYVKPSAPANKVLSKVDKLMKYQQQASQAPAQNARALEQAFDGEGFTGVNPPDPTGDVGLNYYIQSINGSGGSIFSVYDKSTGNKVAGPTAMDSLGSGNCASGSGDPIVLFDEMAQRWMLSEFSSSGNYLCVYVSKTSNPISGGWYNYAFQSPTFPDYPKYGVWHDAYYVGTNESSPTVYALNRAAMLAGNSANFVRLTAPKLAGFGFQMLTPVDHDGATGPTTSSPGYFLRHRDDEVHNSSSNNGSQDYVELWQFNANFSNTSSSSFTKVADIAVSEFDSHLCGLTSFNCFPQSGSSTTLDPLREVIMFRAQYRNFGSYETIVANFVTDVNGNDRGGIRWIELRRNNGGAWGLHQEGTYAPDTKNRWMGSIAMDKDGNIALAYSYGSSSDFAGLRYTGRLATDANGTMNQPETILVNGTSRISSNRFGDYSHMALDPVDGCTFWFTNEYGKSNGQWGTHISSFKFNSCGGGGGTNNPPSASFTDSCTDLACSFDGSGSTDSDGTIASYAWNFGDGSTGTGANASHTYSAAGTYTVSLTVTDNQGATNSTSKSITVTAPGGNDNELVNGVAKTGLSGTTGDQAFFTMEVPAGASNLRFVINGGSGDADLYVRFGSQPTTSAYDCRPYLNGNSETCTISNVQAGTYHVMLRAYNTYSGVSLTGSYTEGGTGNGGTLTETNLSGDRRAWDRYTIDIPAGMSSLVVTISGGSGDADLYVREGSQPSTSSYDCRPYRNGNAETCTFNNPGAGTWHIGLRGYRAYSGVTLNAEWKP